jgi:D-sedoheptulose 7-phosphate isomerase
MNAQTHAQNYLTGLKTVLDKLPLDIIEQIASALEKAHADRRQIFVIGNGGSAATASHMMNDLNKGTLGHKGDAPWGRFRVIALTDNVSLMTAWGNDTDYNHIFSEPLKNLANPGDLLICISASGNSPNILAACDTAKQLGLKIIALTGFTGGKLAKVSDIALVVPSHDYGPVEDVHMILDHILTSYLYETLRRQTEPTAIKQ